jgi:hypothetical protein
MPQVPQFLGPIHQEKQEPTARADPKKSLFNCMLSPHHQIPASSNNKAFKEGRSAAIDNGVHVRGWLH